MTSITVTLPFPDKALSPNSRNKWDKVKATDEAKGWAYLAIRQNYLVFDNPPFPADANLIASFVFLPPDDRYRDLDNMVAMCKAYIDGIFDAIGGNDRKIDTIEAHRNPKIKGGFVTITITESEEELPNLLPNTF
jgi:hypothetical protein